MVKQIEFWREVNNSYGMTHRVVLKTFRVSDDIPDKEAESGAIYDFCTWAHVNSWNHLAHGYDIQHDLDDRAESRRRDTVGFYSLNGRAVA